MCSYIYFRHPKLHTILNFVVHCGEGLKETLFHASRSSWNIFTVTSLREQSRQVISRAVLTVRRWGSWPTRWCHDPATTRWCCLHILLVQVARRPRSSCHKVVLPTRSTSTSHKLPGVHDPAATRWCCLHALLVQVARRPRSSCHKVVLPTRSTSTSLKLTSVHDPAATRWCCLHALLVQVTSCQASTLQLPQGGAAYTLY